ncbi:MAG: hypothetical protein AAFY76_04690 [Cyanobacteria bacterium J06649_11]
MTGVSDDSVTEANTHVPAIPAVIKAAAKAFLKTFMSEKFSVGK